MQDQSVEIKNESQEILHQEAEDAKENEIENQNEDLFDEHGNYDELAAKIKSSSIYQYNLNYLSCPPLEHNPIFIKLKTRLIKFFIIEEKYRVNGPTKEQMEEESNTGVKFNFLAKLHNCLKRMLREVIITEDKQNQELYLKKTYEWFVRQQRAVGLISTSQSEKENDFLNPAQVKAKEEELKAKMEEKRLEFMDDEKHEQYMREIFEAEERTDHKGILPAKDRIKQYKTKAIRRNIPSAYPGAPQNRIMSGIQSI